jgi:hypothetical protein
LGEVKLIFIDAIYYGESRAEQLSGAAIGLPMRKHGGDDALYSAVLVTALFNFYNRLVDGVGLALPDGYVA